MAAGDIGGHFDGRPVYQRLWYQNLAIDMNFCHAVAHLSPGAAEQSVAAAARERGVGLRTMDAYRATPAGTAGPQLVLGFGNLTERAIITGITVIADLLGH